jgi:hypothetical protein
MRERVLHGGQHGLGQLGSSGDLGAFHKAKSRMMLFSHKCSYRRFVTLCDCRQNSPAFLQQSRTVLLLWHGLARVATRHVNEGLARKIGFMGKSKTQFLQCNSTRRVIVDGGSTAKGLFSYREAAALAIFLSSIEVMQRIGIGRPAADKPNRIQFVSRLSVTGFC